MVDAAIATLAQKILALEARAPRLDGTVTDPEWFELIAALWSRLRAVDGTRRNFRLPADATITLTGDGIHTVAAVADVSHTGLRITGRLTALRPGFVVTWTRATAGDDAFVLDVPCHVIWCERGDNGASTAGLSFVQTERRAWGRGFFDWYYRVYREFLGGLARGDDAAMGKGRAATPTTTAAAAASTTPAPAEKKTAKKTTAKKTTAKKTTAKKTAKKKTAKKTTAKKTAKKKTAKKTAKKTTAKKTAKKSSTLRR